MKEIATFAAGCFWGVEEAFRNLSGVLFTRVGYTGGTAKNPTYDDICSHTTGHAEAVELTFDAAKISYEKLLDIFWSTHNPTTKNRQGPDIGSQYRSAIFYHSPAQKQRAIHFKEALQKAGRFGRLPIVTEITPAGEFWQAEEYHQQYLAKRGRISCHM